MGIKFDMKWKINVNGKEYGSVDEMPAPVREVYEKARKIPPGPGGVRTLSTRTTTIVFNGQKYESVDDMPADIRAAYQAIMKAVASGDAPTEEIFGGHVGPVPARPGTGGPPVSVRAPAGIALESFSARKLVVGAALVALFVGLYFLTRR